MNNGLKDSFGAPYEVPDPVGMRERFGVAAFFESAGQTITNGAALTIAHGLSATPLMILGFLKNTSAELGYSVGDVVPISLGADSGSASKGVAVVPDATNLSIRYSDGGSSVNTFSVINKTTGAVSIITNGSWQFILRAWA